MTKKITLLALAIATIFTAKSQSFEAPKAPSILSPSSIYLGPNVVRTNTSKLNKAGTAGSGWYSYLSAYQEIGGKITYYTGQPIWKDSLPVAVYPTGPSNVGMHAVGQLFDPKSDFFNTAGAPALSRFNRYTLDSVRVFYKYYNFNPGSVDTLLVQFYNADKLSRLSYRLTSGQVVGYSDNPTYDKAKHIGVATSSVKILLSDLNNTDSFFSNTFSSFGDSRTIALPSSLNVGENKLCGFTVTFLSGVTAKLGDTIIINSLPPANYPKKKLNTFQPRLFQENDNLGDTSYNYGLFSWSSIRYSTRPTEWFSGNNGINGSKKTAIDGDFFIRYYNLSAKDINNQGYGLGNVYPNPVKVGSDVQIDFALGRGENVNIQLFNVLGSKVADVASGKFASGENTVSFNTANLAPGVYVYTISAGAFKASKKFTVVN